MKKSAKIFHMSLARNLVMLLLATGVIIGVLGSCLEREEGLKVFSWEVAALSGILLLLI